MPNQPTCRRLRSTIPPCMEQFIPRFRFEHPLDLEGPNLVVRSATHFAEAPRSVALVRFVPMKQMIGAL